MAKQLRFTSVFDIIGPVMVGPSSSHTAGAARIGKVVRNIFGETPERVDIYLYESFAKTYRGHGTDIALVGGLLGMAPDDARLPDSLKIAHEQGIHVTFIPKNDKVDHPNTARISLSKGERSMTVTGVSIGGGNIQISEINGFKLSLSMGTPTFITVHQDVPGMIAAVTDIFSSAHVNIGTMTVTREAKGEKAIMIIEVDDRKPELADQLRQLPHVDNVTYFE
ncbi:MAG: L-serine ammonia-lyase, iron-sulfur-dependent subunit beta [Lactobacillus sp.]|jgi:L-serine dehydratase|uniref:L-serine deaminase n=1 Tax=Lacticaseibacillus suilingensis TaxID=2799577 RepID=A0ABW4BGD5_9LACO|nr:L-serine ammonia-lyase, iron-sulfur-dependent subunit beta [Lacticaseibacillus suilingensis]MCI1894018.1 L-serine ammonia-lyase, iron-sulfur-dependent subunit beta [Lactobacillus sp.]MCI1918330.1 L-serine ammonia-lyase, iron-sulfur-dependent subunit beta [Lactobacillus sp.]MCI1941876.1 L-serine ammonia-lyase, iron-sulfur-dependent subunit beta [Lactobacillus sp.]MCI1973048.1 L-serine ammonia-lyase, iron-sulfur-dependent subunit beta [Lactobacillus sp.]MCI2016935.1 L-serine ammonia-lyase, ir